MLADIRDIESYIFAKTDSFLIDANIWMYINFPRYSKRWECEVYSNALNKILRFRCSIYIDELVLSEFINSYSRLEHNLACSLDPQNTSSDFKTFRQSPQFRNVAKFTADAVRRILCLCQCINNVLIMISVRLT